MFDRQTAANVKKAVDYRLIRCSRFGFIFALIVFLHSLVFDSFVAIFTFHLHFVHPPILVGLKAVDMLSTTFLLCCFSIAFNWMRTSSMLGIMIFACGLVSVCVRFGCTFHSLPIVGFMVIRCEQFPTECTFDTSLGTIHKTQPCNRHY